MNTLYLIILTNKYNKCSIDNNQWEPFESIQNKKIIKIKNKNNNERMSKIDPFFFCFPENKRKEISNK